MNTCASRRAESSAGTPKWARQLIQTNGIHVDTPQVFGNTQVVPTPDYDSTAFSVRRGPAGTPIKSKHKLPKR